MTVLDVVDLAATIVAGAATAQRLLAFWGPLGSASSAIAPLLAVGSVVMLALLTGVAVGSLATLIVTSFVLYYVLTEVFGLSVEFVLPA